MCCSGVSFFFFKNNLATGVVCQLLMYQPHCNGPQARTAGVAGCTGGITSIHDSIIHLVSFS